MRLWNNHTKTFYSMFVEYVRSNCVMQIITTEMEVAKSKVAQYFPPLSNWNLTSEENTKCFIVIYVLST